MLFPFRMQGEQKNKGGAAVSWICMVLVIFAGLALVDAALIGILEMVSAIRDWRDARDEKFN
jgi:hypothetical protein